MLRLISAPSALAVIGDGAESAALMLAIASSQGITARRIHDIRHAATALAAGIVNVLTYDVDDWLVLAEYGVRIVGPASSLARLPSPSPKP